MTNSKHRWKFSRVGGVDQVVLRDGSDLTHLEELDPKLWVALAMPTRGVHFDPKMLDAMDTDKDGRVRLPEVLDAVRWSVAALRDPNDLVKAGDSLPLEAIKDVAIRAGAKQTLENLGKQSATSISLADVSDTAKIFAETKFNGDGVVPAESTDDAATKQVIEDIMSTHGSIADRSGKPGVDADRITAFFAEIDALTEWEKLSTADVNSLGAATAAAAVATGAVRNKIDDYFTRCALASIDARAITILGGSDADFATLATQDLSASNEQVAKLPLARVEAGKALPLKSGGLNPAWVDAMNTFADQVALFTGGGTLTAESWASIKAKLAPYDAWLAKKPPTKVETLGLERVRVIAASGAKVAIEGLLKQDLALETESSNVAAIEKLLLFVRDLYRLLNNFVTFAEFYGRRGAAFQVGTLYLDGRGCNLCMDVADPAKHVSLAPLAGAYLAYCDVTRPGGEKRTIVAAFTDGDSDNLLVGRNGIFFDREGKDWDATITKIVANAISIREAFWAPYKKVVRAIEDQVNKRAAAADAEANERLKKTADAVTEATKEAAKAPEKSGIDIGTVAALGVAVGGISAVLAGVMSAMFGLGAWMPLGILAVLLLISGPSMLLAFLKLRQRNLGPLLDANGWAINGRARVNVPFGGALTDMAKLPAGAERSLKDPYAEKSSPWGLYFFLFVLFATALSWYLGRLDRFLPASARASAVLGSYAPAPPAAAPTPLAK